MITLLQVSLLVCPLLQTSWLISTNSNRKVKSSKVLNSYLVPKSRYHIEERCPDYGDYWGKRHEVRNSCTEKCLRFCCLWNNLIFRRTQKSKLQWFRKFVGKIVIAWTFHILKVFTLNHRGKYIKKNNQIKQHSSCSEKTLYLAWLKHCIWMGYFLGVFVLSWLFYSMLKNKIFSNTRTKLLSVF